MPRTVPGAISGATGDMSRLALVMLVELHTSGGVFAYSSGEAATFNSQSFTADRVKSVSGLGSPYIDALNLNLGSATIVLSDMPDSGTTGPITTIESSIDIGGAKVFLHIFDLLSGTGVNVWHGYVKGREYDTKAQTVKLDCSFLWDSPTASIPTSTLQQQGLSVLDTNTVQTSIIDSTSIPIVHGAGGFKIRPTIYWTRTKASTFEVDAVITGTRAGLPIDPADLTADQCTIFETTQATYIELRPGTDTDAPAPTNKSHWSDLNSHPNIARIFMQFPITADNKSSLANVKPDDVRIHINTGRPAALTNLPTQNAAVIVHDVLTDPKWGLGVSASDFDDISSAENQTATEFQCRLEKLDASPVKDWLQNVCRQTGMFFTFNNGKIQLGIKHNGESPIATFSTTRSGGGGGRIKDDQVTVTYADADTLDNQVNAKFNLTNRHEKTVICYDLPAQLKTQATGGAVALINKQDYTFDLLTDYTQVGIAAARLIREWQNANMEIAFSAPIAEGLVPLPGDLITVNAEKIPNGGDVFRVTGQTIEGDVGSIPYIGFKCRLYRSAVYNYDTGGIGVDDIRGSTDASQLGRPPDVIPQTLTIIDKVAGDAGGVMLNLNATWTYPIVDLSGDAAAGIVHDYPIHSVEIWGRYTDDPNNTWTQYAKVSYPSTTATFAINFIKNKVFEGMFVAMSLSNSHAEFGYVEDMTKFTVLGADFSGTTATVASSSAFHVGDYVRCEFEINKVHSVGSGSFTVEPGSGATRTTYFDTAQITHPTGIRIAVAKQNYPVLDVNTTPPRFTMPFVTNVGLVQKPDRVAVKITPIAGSNTTEYLVYWSTAGDPGAGSDHPAFLLTDPLTPPAGVNLIRGHQTRFAIDQTDIGPNGTLIYVRVMATNGRNYSGDGSGNPKMSPLATNAAGDNAIEVLDLAPRVVIKGAGLRVVCLEPSSGLNIKTLNLYEVVIQAKNGSTVLGYLTDSAGSFTSNATEVTFNLGSSRAHTFPLQKSDITTLWPTATDLIIYDYQTNSVGRSAASPTTDVNVSTWAVIGNAVPGGLVFPSAPSGANNTVDGDPETNLASITVTFATSNAQSFTANNIAKVEMLLTKRDAANTTNVGSPIPETFHIAASELSSSSITRTFFLKQGQNFRITEVIARNGDKRTSTTGTADFTAGSLLAVAPGDATVVPAPVFGTITREDGGNKMDVVPITITQNGSVIVWCKTLIIEASINGGTFNQEPAIGLKNQDSLYASASGVYSVTLRIPRKAGVTAQYRATTIAVGKKASSSTLSALQGATGADLSANTGIPTGLTTPVPVKLKSGGLKINVTQPSSNNLNCTCNIYIANGAHGAASLWLNAGDLTTGTATESLGAIPEIANGSFVVPVTKATLLALFPGGIITIYATWSNEFGASTFSSAVTYNLATGEAAGISGDTAVPSSLGTPTANFVPRTGLVIAGLTVGANWNQPLAKWIVIHNGITYFDLTTYIGGGGAQSTSEALARYEIGPGKDEHTIGIKLADLRTVLGTTFNIYFYAQNVGTAPSVSSASPDSGTYTLANGKDIMGGRDAVAQVDVGVMLGTSNNLADNGDMIGATNAGAQNNAVKSWGRVTTLSGFSPSTVGAIRLSTTSSIAWNGSNNSVSIYDPTYLLVGCEENDGSTVNGPIPEYALKQGEVYAVSLVAKAPSGGISGTIRAYAADLSGNRIDATGLFAAIFLDSISSVYQFYGGKMQLSSSYFAGSKMLVLDFSQVSGINTSHPLEIDAIMVVRGNQVKAYQARTLLEDVVVPSALSQQTLPDLGQFGVQQGFFTVGGGGRIVPY